MNEIDQTGTHAIIKAIDPYLPSGIRDNSVLSLEGLIRSRVLAVILVSSIATTAFSFFIFIPFHFFTPYDFSNAIIISIICFCLVSLEYWYFYKSAKLDSSAILYSLSIFVVSVVSIVLTGGYESPVKQILLVCPVIAFLISGRQEGVYNAALVLVVGIVLIILDGVGFDLMQVMPLDILPYLSGVIWFVTVMLIVVCLYVYDLLLEDKRSIKANR